ncbi:MAG TPA: hypothetical protein VGE88_02040 [Lysobacter sp.]
MDLSALSFGYFSLCEQRKVTRAPQVIGSLAGDSSLLCEALRRAERVTAWVPAFAGMTKKQRQNGFQLSLE